MHARTGLCSLVYGLCSPTLSPAARTSYRIVWADGSKGPAKLQVDN